MRTKIHFHFLFVTLALLVGISEAEAQGTLFTYQGRLNTNSVPANGFFDFKFSLYTNAAGTPPQIGSTITQTDIGVTNGLFTTTLDFGPVFTGNATWLSISVRSNGVPPYTPVTPLQELTPAPYAITAENLDGTLPANQLTGTLPAGLLSGSYGGVLNLNNASDSFTGNGSGLTSLNASDLTTGTVSPARLPGDVAYLDVNQTFTGSNTFEGNAGSFVINNFGSPINTNLFTGLSLQYNYGFGEGAIMSAFNNGEGYLSFYTKAASTQICKQMIIDFYGGVGIDQQGANSGAINNGSTNGAGLTFGIASGEGIASNRQTATNQYGLDFYTDFTRRMSITQQGLVGIGAINSSGSTLEVNGDVRTDYNRLLLSSGTDTNSGMVYTSTGEGVFNGEGPFIFGYNGGALGGLFPTTISLTWDYLGNAWVSNNFSTGTLTIRGGSDLAEPFEVSSLAGDIPEGSVVVIDEENPGHLKLSSRAYDTHVAGVLSGANGIHPGIQMHQQGLLEGGKNVALTGRVYVLADAANGAIKPGDLLTTSTTPGHAMKVKSHSKAQGAILGKAMTGLSTGKGMVLVLVTLQ